MGLHLESKARPHHGRAGTGISGGFSTGSISYGVNALKIVRFAYQY